MRSARIRSGGLDLAEPAGAGASGAARPRDGAPVAVLVLCVPVFGFGAVPMLVALFLYALLPIF